jgi:hypothetical protein
VDVRNPSIMKQDVVEGMDEVAVSLDTGLEQQHVRHPSKRCNNTPTLHTFTMVNLCRGTHTTAMTSLEQD